MADTAPPQPSLSRSIGFWALVCYGVGDILGAGIYGLVGKVAAESGRLVWASFLVAMLTASLTGLSYAELVGRRPKSAGESAYAMAAFHWPWLGFFVGWMVFCSGVVSMATVAHACGNYVHAMWPETPTWAAWIMYVAFISTINFWGIRQSSWMNIAFTLIEVSGLLLVIIVGALSTGQAEHAKDAVAPMGASFLGVMQGATLAFFAYIGFEDMVNVAEEVKSPERTFPKAIVIAVLVCGALYLLVSLACVAVIPAPQLAQSEAPLLDVVRRAAPFVPAQLYTVIALIAVVNTGLLNSIMASRLLYGMANQSLLPSWLSAVHPRTRTPHRAVLTLASIALILIFSGTLTQLAATTSLLLLLVFIIVNISLLRIRALAERSAETFAVPLGIPIAAVATCFGLLVFVERTALFWGAALLVVGGGFAFVAHRHAAMEGLERDPPA